MLILALNQVDENCIKGFKSSDDTSRDRELNWTRTKESQQLRGTDKLGTVMQGCTIYSMCCDKQEICMAHEKRIEIGGKTRRPVCRLDDPR